MKIIRKTYLAALAVLLSPMAANADLVYDEAVDGDTGQWNGGDVGFLGSVTSGDFVLGTMTDNNGEFWDGYEFTLDGSVNLINIALIQALQGDTLNNWQFYNGAGTSVLQNCGTITQANPLVSCTVTNLTGQYRLGNNSNRTSAWYSYQISFDEPRTSVPEPGTLALLGLGLAGMGISRRKKKV